MKYSSGILILTLFLIAERSSTIDAIRCYACSSWNAQCGTTITTTTNLQWNTESCSGSCFTRKGTDGIIYRGCSSGFWFNPALSSTETSRTIGGVIWCFCNSELCNTAECSAATATTVATTTVSGATTVATTGARASSLRCLDCSSYNAACGATVTDTTNIGTVPCSSPNKCYTRTDSSGIVRRGCSAGFWPVVNASTTCEVKNGETWCYCENASSCNTAACTSCSTTTITTTTSSGTTTATTSSGTTATTTTTAASCTTADSQLCQFITCGQDASADAVCPIKCSCGGVIS